MDIPLVSIAIITYNQDQFIEETIESVLCQDYKNIEIVVADDCSSDNTPDILKSYAAKYPDIFKLILADKNQGVTENSNAAYKACTGKYIAWLGGDDIFLPGKISTQVSFMEKNPEYVITYHDLEVFDSSTNNTIGYYNYRFEGDLSILIKKGCFNGGSSTMVLRNSCPENGFNSFIPVASDWLYWIDCLSGGGKIKPIEGVFARYRRHNANVTKKNSNVLNRILVDKLNTITLVMLKYPEFTNEALHNLANTFRGQAVKSSVNYLKYLKTSLKIKFTLKTFVLLFLYYLSLGRFKRIR